MLCCLFGSMTSGALYLNMASFFPVFVDTKYNSTVVSGQKVQVISPFLISLGISAFMTAQLFSVKIHAITISKMGRKRASLIGFSMLVITNMCLGLAALLPVDRPTSFMAVIIATRIFQGYADSLSVVVITSIANISFTENKTKVIGWVQSAYGLGMIIGPASGSVVYGLFGF